MTYFRLRNLMTPLK